LFDPLEQEEDFCMGAEGVEEAVAVTNIRRSR